MKHVSIAIDGPSGAGKSTLARQLAERLNYLYVDTGAIYRTVGLAARRAGLDPQDVPAVAALLPTLHIDLRYEADGLQHMLLNGEDVSQAIRQPEVSMYASKTSALPEVRAFLLQMQRDLAATRDVIMDGRDIGTVVLPDASVKIFLTAAPEMRARRRYEELRARGDDVTYEEVLADLLRRDENDISRAAAPLRQAEDAVLVDTTDLDLEESLHKLINTVRERLPL